jgi:hypothetical protein
MYALYEAGRFGNKLQTWPDLATFYRDKVEKRVVMRYKGPAGGGWVAYELEPDQVRPTACKWEHEGANLALVALNESAPDDRLLIQGEVMLSTAHLSLRYSREKAPMRKALASAPLHAEGLLATELLRYFLDPSSLEDLRMLLDTYEDAVVEFSTWSADVGELPHRNTVFWEVRNY